MFLKCKRLLGAFLYVINKEADCICDRESDTGFPSGGDI